MLLGDVAARNAAKRPHDPAVRFPGTGAQRTWAELSGRATRLGHALRGLAGRTRRAAILAEDCPEHVEALYGVPDAGLALVLLDHGLPVGELVRVLDDCRAEVVVATPRYAEVVADVRAEVPALQHVVVTGDPVAGVLGYEELLAGASAARDPVATDDMAAWVVYPAGSSRGALLSHRNLTTAVLQSVVHHAPGPDERFLNPVPFSRGGGTVAVVQQFHGGCVVQSGSGDPAAWPAQVEAERITGTRMTPSVVAAVLREPETEERDLSTLRSITYDTAPLPVEVLREAIDRFGPVVSRAHGTPELAGDAFVLDRAAHVRAVRGEEHLLATVGEAMCLAEARVVGPDGAELPDGRVGELEVRGEQTALGYLGQPEATAAAYRDGWFRTGERASRDAGCRVTIATG